MEALLEVVAQRRVQERPAVRRQLHGGRQAALHHGQVAGGEVAIELVDVRHDLEPIAVRQARRVDARAAHHDHAQGRNSSLGLRERIDHAPKEGRTHA